MSDLPRTPRRTAARRPRRGTQTVEFAVVAPVLFFAFLGLIEVGRGLMVSELLNHAAHIGARKAVIQKSTSSSTADVTSAVNTFLSSAGVSGATTRVYVNDSEADANTAQQNDEVAVVVNIPVSSVTWVPGGSFLKNRSLYGRFLLRRE